MLAQAPHVEPWLNCRRHAVLLTAVVLGTGLARFWGPPAPIALAFACYGAVHGAAVAGGLRPRPGWVRAIAFVATACLLSGSLARLGLRLAPLLAGVEVERAVVLVVAVSAFAGALGYGALLRCLLRYRVAPRPLVTIAFTCAVAASAALMLMRQFPRGGSAWLAVFWWLAFSGGLCAAAGRRPLSAPEASDATEQ